MKIVRDVFYFKKGSDPRCVNAVKRWGSDPIKTPISPPFKQVDKSATMERGEEGGVSDAEGAHKGLD
jgi:hypothetical protein